MFVKLNKSKNHTYVQLVESFRENGKSKHRVAYNFGRLDVLLENDQLTKIGLKLLAISQSSSHSILELKENKRLCYGHIVYHHLWKRLKISDLLAPIIETEQPNFPLLDSLQYLVYLRLLKPCSKLKSFSLRDQYLGINPNIALHHLYHTLDFLAKYKDKIETLLYERQKSLFHLELDVVFYDVTTFHFESQKNDELRDFGFSKANKINEVQVMMGLLVNGEGRPIGYELFEGNTFEGKTLVKSLKKLEKRFAIKRVVIVADKGMHNSANLHTIREAGFDYIVSSKIKTAKKTVKDKLFEADKFQSQFDANTGELLYKHKSIVNEFTYVEKTDDAITKHSHQDNIIVSWSQKRADADKSKRDRLIQRAKKRIEGKALKISDKKGAKRYFKIKGNSTIIGLDEEKIKQDAKWDGYYAVQYSGKTLSNQQVLEQYHYLWKIEESFRVMKTTMKTRPIFHWTPKRIKGHFMLCFLAFMLERTLELRLKKNKINLSPQAIKEALNSLEVSELELREQLFYLKGNATSEAKKILRSLKIAPLKNVFPKEEFKLFD